MKLYYKKGSCSLAIRILLHELNLNCEYIAIDPKTKRTEQGDDYYTINPKGAVPTLVLDDGTVLTENAVIQQYLVDMHKAYQLLPSVGEIERYQILIWLNFVATDLHKGFSPFFNPNIPDEVKSSALLPLLEGKLKLVDEQLSYHKFIFGNDITLPDFYLFVVLTWAPRIGIKLSKYPYIERYCTTMKARPAVQVSLQEEGLL